MQVEFLLVFARDDVLPGEQAVLDGVLGDDGLALRRLGTGALGGVAAVGGHLCFGSHDRPLQKVSGYYLQFTIQLHHYHTTTPLGRQVKCRKKAEILPCHRGDAPSPCDTGSYDRPPAAAGEPHRACARDAVGAMTTRSDSRDGLRLITRHVPCVTLRP